MVQANKNSPPIIFKSSIFYLFILSAFFLSLVQLENYDIWWHLKTGEWITGHLSLPHTQLFSYAIEGASWVSHSWLFQTLVFLLHKFLGGVNALVIFRAVIVSLILWVTLKGFLRRVYFPLFLVTAWLFSTMFLSRVPVRPELVSALLLSIYLYILFNKKNLWWLVLIQVIWVNMHGYAILGPLLLILFLLSEFIKERFKLAFDWKSVRYLEDKASGNKTMLVLVITIFLFLITPYHLKSFGYPLFAIKSFFETARSFYHINELGSFSLPDALFSQKNILLTSSIALFLVSLLLNIRRLDLFNIFIFVFFFMIYGGAERHKGFFAIVSCFCVLENLKTGNISYLKNYFKFRYAKILSLALMIFLSFYIMKYQFLKGVNLSGHYIYSRDLSSKSRMLGKNNSRYPEKAVDFIIENRIKGPVFNSFNIGGYLIWRLYPQHKVFVDGRTEVYGKRFMDGFVRSVIDPKAWQELDVRYSFNMTVLDYSTTDFYYRIIRDLYEDERWKMVFIGDVAVVFVKDAPDNQRLIRMHGISLEDWVSAETKHVSEFEKSPAYPGYFLNIARFFIDGMDMPEPALRELEKARLADMGCYEVWQLTGYAYFRMRRLKEARDAFMKSLEINPHIAEPYLNLGSVAAEAGLYDDARSLYKQALRLDKTNKAARENLGRLP